MLPVLFASGYACATRDLNTATPPPRTSDVTSTAPSAPETVPSAARGVVPVGQEMDVRLGTSLSSETSKVEQRFEATTVVDLIQDGRVLVPAGSVVQGVVVDVDKAGRVDRDGALTLAFDRIRVRGRQHDIRARIESRCNCVGGGDPHHRHEPIAEFGAPAARLRHCTFVRFAQLDHREHYRPEIDRRG